MASRLAPVRPLGSYRATLEAANGLPPRIGEPIYQSRRELALEPRVLERLALGSGVEALAHAMAGELAAAQP